MAMIYLVLALMAYGCMVMAYTADAHEVYRRWIGEGFDFYFYEKRFKDDWSSMIWAVVFFAMSVASFGLLFLLLIVLYSLSMSRINNLVSSPAAPDVWPHWQQRHPFYWTEEDIAEQERRLVEAGVLTPRANYYASKQQRARGRFGS